MDDIIYEEYTIVDDADLWAEQRNQYGFFDWTREFWYHKQECLPILLSQINLALNSFGNGTFVQNMEEVQNLSERDNYSYKFTVALIGIHLIDSVRTLETMRNAIETKLEVIRIKNV